VRWKKLGHLFQPDGTLPWMRSHAANPFGVRLAGDRWRVFFTCRDDQQRSHIASLTMDPGRDFALSEISTEPVLAPGPPGAFDDSGCAVGYVVPVGGRLRLYYLGWNLKVTVPWLNTIGLAIEDPATGRFERWSPAPMMDRDRHDPFTISYPSLLREEGRWRMWYGSNLQWGKVQEDMQHVIKYAESRDGLHWRREGRVVVGLEHENEYALSKPFVLRDPDRYRMWYSYRGRGQVSTYRIGYAESPDGLQWTRRDDEAGIDVSADGWDAEMVCYPFVFDHGGRRYMLYNGNGYGRSGFGVAVLES
jgi:hypothetical protein